MAATLLPELLLALVGAPGDAFVVRGSSLVLADEIDWVSPPEREQLNRLAALGAHYAALEAFVEATSGSNLGGLDAGAALPPSLYRLALSNGISELLDVFRSAVLRVEAHLLHLATPLPLLTVQHFLLEWETLLPEAAALVGEVEGRGLAGAAVMRVLSLRAHSGAPAVQSCAQRLLWHCRQVLFKQLESWLVHGMLLDRAGEFFVRRSDGAEDGAGGRGGAASPSPLRVGAGAAGVGGGMLDWEPLEWHAGFQVSLSDLPPDVSLPTAEAVLFIGKAVRVLKQPMSSAASHQALRAHAEILGFSQTLHRLQAAEDFSAAQFDHCIESMRAKVSSLLWDLVQHRCDLMGQFEAVRSYFLLGKGDFYQLFLDEARALLAGEPKPNTAEADIALAFQQSALKSTAETDPLFAALALRWMPADRAAQPEGEGGPPKWHPARCASITVPRGDAWDGLFLECAVEWPLQLLFPPEVLSKYGALWQHMFRLRRVQLGQEEAWATLQALQHRKAGDDSLPRVPAALRAALSQERQQQHHFVRQARNLALYLSMDVVDASFSQLRSAILSAGDFSAADAAHRQYVDSLVSQAFLDMKQLMLHLEDILRRCRELCTLVQRVADGHLDGAAEALRGISKQWRLKQRLFYTMLSSGRILRAPALRQLVTRLNFNGFAERQASAGLGWGPGVTAGGTRAGA
ncbi:hypothetical protein ABPG77_005335 [Micractinium sp. CCAP 211/92]